MTMQDMNIREHMEVLGEDGGHVGVVDKVDGDRIKLTRKDSEAGGKHHYIMMDVVSHVDEHVHLMIPAEQAMREWEEDPKDANSPNPLGNTNSTSGSQGGMSSRDQQAEQATSSAEDQGDQPA